MRLTQEDYKNIAQYLAKQGVRDTDFSEAISPLKGNEEIPIIQGGKNSKVVLRDLVKSINLLNSPDLINITSLYNVLYLPLEEAIKYVSSNNRKLGLYITFMEEDGLWGTYQFTGGLINQWNISDKWTKRH